MKIHRTVNHDENLKPVKAPGLAIFIRQTEARELMMQMRIAVATTSEQKLRAGDTAFAALLEALKEALEDG